MHYIFEGQDFCKQWEANAEEDDYQYCRKCNSQPCQQLWEQVKKLAAASNCNGIQSKTLSQHKPFRIYTTQRQGIYYCKFQSLAKDRVGREWGIPKEDFLYVLKTGDDRTPSDTRQKSHVEPIIELIRKQAQGQNSSIKCQKCNHNIVLCREIKNEKYNKSNGAEFQNRRDCYEYCY